MLTKLFKNKKFIFIFTFAIEFLMYQMFYNFQFFGKFFFPDIGLAPVFGLMFGPAGCLGFSVASFVSGFFWGDNFFSCLLDSAILFLISVVAYKLWYLLPPKENITPKFNSIRNVFKFFLVMFFSSLIYLIFLQISFVAVPEVIGEVYSLSNFFDQFSYAFNIFNFSILFGLILISIFNVLKIPLNIPKKFDIGLNVPYKLFIIPLIALITFLIITPDSMNFNMPILYYFFFIVAFSSVGLFCLNKFDVGHIHVSKFYSILESIIAAFLIVMVVPSFWFFSEVLEFISNTDFFYLSTPQFVYIVSICIVIIFSIFLTLIHIYLVEKIITNPINELTDAADNYVSDGELKNPKHVGFRLEIFLNNEDDISKLMKLFNVLIELIKTNLDNLKKSIIEKERFKTELNVAHNIQNSMLSKNFKEFSSDRSFEIHALMSPAREVGGDFYDFFNIDNENISFVVGDVSGKGIPAALFMVKTMHLIRNHSKFAGSISEVFEQVNNLACERNDDILFVTAWLGKLNTVSGKLSFVNAGHNPPLLRRNNSDFEYYECPSNIVLGTMDGMPYDESEIRLNKGDMLFLYTDGVTEANNKYQGFYGEDRLKDALNKYKDENLNKIIENIKQDIFQFCGSEDQFDDMTMLIIKFNGD